MMPISAIARQRIRCRRINVFNPDRGFPFAVPVREANGSAAYWIRYADSSECLPNSATALTPLLLIKRDIGRAFAWQARDLREGAYQSCFGAIWRRRAMTPIPSALALLLASISVNSCSPERMTPGNIYAPRKNNFLSCSSTRDPSRRWRHWPGYLASVFQR